MSSRPLGDFGFQRAHILDPCVSSRSTIIGGPFSLIRSLIEYKFWSIGACCGCIQLLWIVLDALGCITQTPLLKWEPNALSCDNTYVAVWERFPACNHTFLIWEQAFEYFRSHWLETHLKSHPKNQQVEQLSRSLNLKKNSHFAVQKIPPTWIESDRAPELIGRRGFVSPNFQRSVGFPHFAITTPDCTVFWRTTNSNSFRDGKKIANHPRRTCT